MPLRSQFDALVRDKGKDDHTPDQKSARGKDTPTDFKSMVKAAAPKLKLDKDDTTLEEESGGAVESDKDKDVPASAPSGVFGQAILAFEQLLERQRRENGDQKQPASEPKVLPEGDTVAASVEIGAPTGLESEQQRPGIRAGQED